MNGKEQSGGLHVGGPALDRGSMLLQTLGTSWNAGPAGGVLRRRSFPNVDYGLSGV